jgi:DNA-directed RNA polymerase subunit RPC12/RpoP
MKRGVISCPHCGSSSLRRSRRQSWIEYVNMIAGVYPFRCLDCNERSWIGIWLFSRLLYAKCPKCLGLQLGGWPKRHYHLSFWRNLLSTFGAHRYRCKRCRCNFLSFRPRYRIADEMGEELTLPDSSGSTEGAVSDGGTDGRLLRENQ